MLYAVKQALDLFLQWQANDTSMNCWHNLPDVESANSADFSISSSDLGTAIMLDLNI